jgi:hypothetical protein
MKNKFVDQQERDVQKISESEIKEVSGGVTRITTRSTDSHTAHKQFKGEGRFDVPW